MSAATSFNVEKLMYGQRLPVSRFQSGILYDCLVGDNTNYLVSATIEIRGKLDRQKLDTAWAGVIREHAALRTTFDIEDAETPSQIVAQTQRSDISEYDIRQMSAGEQDTSWRQIVEMEESVKYLLDGGHLFKLSIVCLSDDRCRLLLVCHHLTTDIESLCMVASDLAAALTGKVNSPTGSNKLSYSQLCEIEQDNNPGRARTFWRTRGRMLKATRLGRKFITEAQTGGRSHRYYKELPDAEAVLSFCENYEISFEAVINAAWALLLSERTGLADVTHGVVVSAREALCRNASGVAGLFSSLLPLRTTIEGDTPVLRWISAVHCELQLLKQHSAVSFSEAVPASRLKTDPLFDTVVEVTHCQRSWNSKLHSSAVAAELLEVNCGNRFTTTLHFILSAQRGCAVDFRVAEQEASSIDAAQTVNRVAELISALCARPEASIANALAGAGLETRIQQLKLWNNRASDLCVDSFVIDRFEMQSTKSPTRIAVSCGSASLTYAQLNACADNLATHLHNAGVCSQSVVGVSVERSLMLPVSLLAVLKLGAVFLPIDPESPPERFRWILEDADVDALILSSSGKRKTSVNGVFGLLNKAIPIARLKPRDLAKWRNHACKPVQRPSVSARDLAYIIYTSGSTGNPKGVMIEQLGFLNYILWALQTYICGPSASCEVGAIMHGSYAFDMCITNLFVPLLCGQQLQIVPESIPVEVQLQRNAATGLRVALFKAAPPHLGILKDELSGNLGARVLVVGGEAFPSALASSLLASNPGVRIINEYGPTETVVGCSYREIVGEDLRNGGSIPIGRPINNMSCYVLDERLEPVPVGAVGELFIGGVGVARGYLRRPGLTAERFLPDPFSDSPGARLYRSGDLARWKSDGVLEYLGRVDDQVKIRGHRVELGEVEAALASVPGVQAAGAVAKPEADGLSLRLIGYITGDAKPATVRERLRELLPDYLIPSVIVSLPELPITAHGKLDRKALPDPEDVVPLKPDNEVDDEPPQGPIEEALAEIWCEILSLKSVGRHDNFFNLGGTSLSGIRVLQRLGRVLGRDVQARYLFESPVLTNLARRLTDMHGKEEGAVAGDVRFLIVPPLTGSGLICAQLSRELSRLGEVCLLSSYAAESVDHITEFYLSEVDARAALTERVVVVGWSFAGLVAFDLARKLHERGRQTAALVLDSYFPSSKRWPHTEEVLSRYVAGLLQLGGMSTSEADKHASSCCLNGSSIEERLSFLCESELIPYLPSSAVLIEEFRRYESGIRASHSHVAIMSNVPLLLVTTDGYPRKQQDRWKRLAPEARIFQSTSDHYGLMLAAEPERIAKAWQTAFPEFARFTGPFVSALEQLAT